MNSRAAALKKLGTAALAVSYLAAALWLWHLPATAQAAEPAGPKAEIKLPLARTAYQTNEDIHLAVVRLGPDALPAGDLKLSLAAADGSNLAFRIPVAAVPKVGADARATEHLYLNARLLRPGAYTVKVDVDGAVTEQPIELYSHVRRTDFKLLNWGRTRGEGQLAEGEDNLGFNLFYGHYAVDNESNFIRAGVDFMHCCTMSGGHQMDLRMECDWSDPYVVRGGGVARVVRQALAERTRSNVVGVHFYDEPGLTWYKHPDTGKATPHGVPAQMRAYQSAWDREAPAHHKVDPNNAEDVARWRQWARWKLGFMDAAWKASQFGVSYVDPEMLSTTQSQYGFSAYADGYYFNVVRSLPVVSGHGGYHDYGLYLFNPSYTLTMARARDLAKPCWYLPAWYGNTTSEQFRLEQYLSFQTNIQGMMSPPDIDPVPPSKKPAAEGVVESNKLMGRLGTVFNTMPVTRPPVAVLYSLSNMIHKQMRDMTVNYFHSDKHGRTTPFVYLALKMIQQDFIAVVEEDVLDGTAAACHKALVLGGVDHVDANVKAALEQYIADGGMVLLTGDCAVKIRGAVNLGVTPKLAEQKIVDELVAEGKWKEARPYMTLGKHLKAAKPLAEALGEKLEGAGIRPVFDCTEPGISASRQAAGDVEYLFAVNAATDWDGPSLNMLPATATITIPKGPVYDAVRGGAVAEFHGYRDVLRGEFRFGPGQMRVFARTARPIGSVRALTPVVRRDYTLEDDPLSVEVGGVVLDAAGGALSGSIPLRVRLIDPLGEVRYDLYRATRLGALTLRLPLAVNDPAGEWSVTVQELLGGNESRAAFSLPAVPRCGALAGRRERALFFEPDRETIFRFFRVHRAVTVVKGKSEYNNAAAERIAKILQPWDVDCAIVTADEVNKARSLAAEEAPTWAGLHYAGSGQIKPGAGNNPVLVGFAVKGSVILLGTPEDNPLIAFLAKEKFLPYAAVKDQLPGRGRGYLAWQRDAVGYGQESVTVIAHDEAGMGEAVGTLYELMAGIAPLTRCELPAGSSIVAASKALAPPEPKVAWQAVLPDRAQAMKADGNGLTVLTWDRSVSTLGADGTPLKLKPVKPADFAKQSDAMKAPAAPDAMKAATAHKEPGRIVKHVAAKGVVAVGYWGGGLRVLDGEGNVKFARQMQQDITGLAWVGETLAVGLGDGRVVGLSVK